MDATEVNSLFESNNIGEYLRAKFMDEFFAAMANNGPGDIDDNNKTNSGNVDGNRTHGTTNNDQTVDGLATEMRKLTNSDFCLPPNVGAIKRHDRFATNNKERQQRPSLPTAQKNWSSKSPTGKEVCVFCKNNGEPKFVYTSHKVKDNQNRVCCPRLRGYTCPICGATGDSAHTVRYCPLQENMIKVANELMTINQAPSF